MTEPALLAIKTSVKCPTRPKPVMSVQAFAPASCIISPALLLSVHIDRVIFSIASGEAISAFMAVEIIPVPRGFVRTSLSPGFAPLLEIIFSGWIMPVTERPYFISSSSTLCPPARTAPASLIFSMPPRRIFLRISPESFFMGKPTRFMAVRGRPPMA